MKRSGKPLRCVSCKMHLRICICGLLPRISTRTRLILLLHASERKKSTNTGTLAARCLQNSSVVLRGAREVPEPLELWPPGTQPLLLFPDADAVPLAAWTGCAKPISLVVPDGTWGQAAHIRVRVSALGGVPCVTLPPAPPAIARLRGSPHTERLSTMEAVARALGVLEGPEVQDALERVLRVMVERTLWSRGQFPATAVTGGIPGEVSSNV